MPRYIAIGGSAIDHIVLVDGREMPPTCGGSAIYSAMGMRVWNDDVGIVTLVSTKFHQEWVDVLVKAGIDVSGIKRSKRSMGIEGKIIYNIDGSRTLAAAGRLMGIAERFFTKTFLGVGLKIWRSFCPRRTDIPEAYYEAIGAHIAPMESLSQKEFLKVLHGHVQTITLDPPPLLPGQPWGKKPAHLSDLSMARVVLPSEQEIKEYYGEIPVEEGAKRLMLEEGAPEVVIKMGERGSLVYCPRSQSWQQVPIYKTEVKDVTGAGDTFCGGFLVGLDETGDPVQAALYGAVSASFAIEGFGALYSLKFTRKDAEARLAKMRSEMKSADLSFLTSYGGGKR